MTVSRVSGAVLACVLVAMGAPVASARAQVTQGMALFGQNCGSCHEKPAAGSRAPDREALSQQHALKRSSTRSRPVR